MTREEWIKIYNAKDGTWYKDDLIDKAYEIMTSPIKTNYDRIKSMSAEDLTEFINNISTSLAVKMNGEYIVREKDSIKQWLLQEVSENDR